MYWDPFEQIKRMQSEMNRAFSGTPRGGFGQMPAMDLADHENELVAIVDLPGVKKEEIKIRCTEDYLEVSAQSSEKKEEKKKEYYFSERSASTFHRGVSLPAKVKPQDATSTLKNGVLEIRLPKQKPHATHHGHAIKVD